MKSNILLLSDIENHLHKQPGFHLWKNLESKYLGLSHDFAQLIGFERSAQVKGKTDFDLPWAQYAEQARNDDQIALNGEVFQGIEYGSFPGVAKDIPFYITKHAFYDVMGQARGVYASGYPLLDLKSHSEITSLIKSDNSEPDRLAKPETPELTNIEKICLHYIVRGKTCREIANIRRKSVRTIEFHLDNLKRKFDVRTKSELIDMAINSGYLSG